MTGILKIRTEACFGTKLECAPRTFSLFRDENGRYFFRHWQMKDDLRRSKKYSVRKEDIEPILTKLGQLTLPAFPEHICDCDGEYTELEVGDYGGKSIFRWWSVPPSGWEQLDSLVSEMFRLMPNRN